MRESRPNDTLTLTLAPTQAKEPSRVLEKLRKHVLATSKSNHIWYLIEYDSWGDNIANYTGSFSQLLYVAVCASNIRQSENYAAGLGTAEREWHLYPRWVVAHARCRTQLVTSVPYTHYGVGDAAGLPARDSTVVFCLTNTTRSSTYTAQMSSTRKQRT